MTFHLLIALVVLSPLPFGSVHGWSAGLLATATGLLMIAWAAQRALARKPPAVGLYRTWPFVLLFAVTIGWAALQAAPITPQSWHHPLWQAAEHALGSDLTGRISLDPAATMDSLARLLSYGAVFWLALQHGGSAKRARQALLAVALAGLVYASYGLLTHYSGAEKVLWLDKPAYHGDVTATFINKNSFAAYAGLSLVSATALLIQGAIAAGAAVSSARARLVLLIERFGRGGWLLTIACLVPWVALLLSHSRGGLASTVIGLAVLAVTAGLSRGGRRPTAMVVGAMLALAVSAGALFALAGRETDERLAQLAEQRVARLQVYELTARAAAEAPLTGTGYGTFAEVFRFYRLPDMAAFYLRAHNSYLENALELGIPATLSLLAALALVTWRCLRGALERRIDAIYPATGLAATALVASHSLVDFSLQMPAVAVTYSLLIGIGCAQSWSSRVRPDPW
jgi:O-antigen ligase